MDTHPFPPVPVPAHLGRLGIARLLVLLQGAFLVAATMESAVVLAGSGPGAAPTLALTAGAALLTLLSALALAPGRRWTRRWVMAAEAGTLVIVAVDLLVGTLLGAPELLPMTAVVRVGVPLAVLWLLRHLDTPAAGATADRSPA